MRKRFLPLLAGLAIGAAFAGPVYGGASVDRIEDLETVLAVRMDDDFPIASLMRADCSYSQWVQRPDGSAVETMKCQLSDRPVMIPEFQGQPPTRAFTNRAGPCVWTSDFQFARDESIVLASSVHYTVTPTGRVNVVAYYPAQPLAC